ncbi:MAG: type II 3-dehydroquinate dehydratase [Bacteroidales bacterium]|nr:type II 3-dehydroquinate dehydratase [Bacteroidales bacterium]
MRIKIINGPNLNMIGTRETDIYGTTDMLEFLYKLKAEYSKNEFTIFQSNHEGEIIDELQKSISEKINGIILNAGALTHYSIAIRDAISSINIPVIEVHISNIFAREEFRKKSVISDVCVGIISGFGLYSYDMAIRYLCK